MRNPDLPRPISPFQSLLAMPREKKQDQNFGPRLATLRKARSLTQVQLAALAGATQRARVNTEQVENDAETHGLWKRFRMVTHLPGKDQRAVIRLINSLAAVSALRLKNFPASGESA